MIKGLTRCGLFDNSYMKGIDEFCTSIMGMVTTAQQINI